MGKFLNVQFSVFSNSRIEPTAANASNLMQKINSLKKFEFLPNIISGQNFDLITGKINSISNLSFITPSNQSQIMCMDNRIDCIFNFSPSDNESLSEGVEFCRSILTIIMKEFSIIGNRLALNINNISDNLNENFKESECGRKLISQLDFYNTKNLIEWSTRCNTRIPIKISNKDEFLNIITELDLTQNIGEKSKKILCHLDINTIPENQTYRFTYDKLDLFVAESNPLIDSIINDFERWVSCD